MVGVMVLGGGVVWIMQFPQVRLVGIVPSSTAIPVTTETPNASEPTATAPHVIFSTAALLPAPPDKLQKTSTSTPMQELVIASLPTEHDVQNLSSIWKLASYPMLEINTRVQSYNVTVNSSDKWLWGTEWCSIGQDLLDQNLSSLSVSFSINGASLPRQKIRDTEGTEFDDNNRAWRCHYWVTTLSRWSQNTEVPLSIVHNFDVSVNDGKDTYPSGSYIQELIVKVK